MARKGPVRSEERRSYWQAAMELQHESGLSIRAFCRQEGLAESAFYFWRRELTQRAGPKSIEAPPKPSLPKFVPVEINTRQSSPLVIELSSGTKLNINSDCSPELLRTTLESLRC